MGRAYAGELKRLKQTVAFACGVDINPLVALLADFVSQNLIFVGSGGSYTAATFAAALHEKHTGRLTKALTPLEAANGPFTTNTAAVLISARGSNSDIIKAFQSLLFKDPVAAICASEKSKLLRLIDDSGIGEGYGFTVPGGKDGFLATNSLLATLILLSRSYESLFGLPGTDLKGIAEPSDGHENAPYFSGDASRLAKADTIIALSSGWGWPAAIDLESKCSESGLANVLLSDFRNFAHGRHNWLRTRAESTAIVSLEDKDNTRLAGSMLELVPDRVQKFRIYSDRRGPGAAIELVYQVLHLVGALGAESGIDPGRPSVEKFGRKLYQNGFKAYSNRSVRETWIARKAEAIGLFPHGKYDFLADALDEFLDRLQAASLGAVVLDYDGTLCGPSERYTGPSKRVAHILNALLSEGLIVGIATGRGNSAHNDLRKSISSGYWNKVLLGLYNGALILPLSEECHAPESTHNPQLMHVRKVLEPFLASLDVQIAQNKYQISLRPSAPIDLERLRRSVNELIHDVDSSLGVCRSAHSVDILSSSTSKRLIPKAVAEFAGLDEAAILRVGDLGEWGGNDFDLLNEGISLSVDRVSSQLERCWNLGPPGFKGVATTVRYLQAITPSEGEFKVDTDLFRRGKAGVRFEGFFG